MKMENDKFYDDDGKEMNIDEALKGHLTRAKELNKELKNLPNQSEIDKQFSGLPTTDEIDELRNALCRLPKRNMFKLKALPTVDEILELNQELDKTVQKLEKIDELENKRVSRQ